MGPADGDRGKGVTGSRGLLRAVAIVAATVHLGGVAALVVVGLVADPPLLDPLGPITVGAVYGAPALLAALGLRDRRPLLLAAAASSMVLAVVPFSVHSFVLGPVGLVYAIAFTTVPGEPGGPSDSRSVVRAVGVVIGCPLLLIGALLALFVHEDPACYTRVESGEVTIERDPGDVMSEPHSIGEGSGIVEQGCTSDTVVWWEAAIGIGLSALAVLGGARVVRRATRSVEPA